MVRLYTWFAFMGLMVVSASVLMGFRHEPGAPAGNYVFNGVLYAAYMMIHVVMMSPWYKRLTTGAPEGNPKERRIYTVVAVLTWLFVYGIHRPLPGPALELPDWITFLGLCGFLLGSFAFSEGGTFESFKGFFGVPGSEASHSATAETPLQIDGSYASVRHPMYRGFTCLAAASLLIHPNAAQLAWGVVLSLTFIVFIPIEESQLLHARGEEYRAYMQQTPHRLFRGIW
ncbi:MAG: isoprenylcysteine carboxylmethyltransferase family protein [Deltaproteobacteria bacterium]|nr:isoprenylcysteine carboxylmethyltransferase family protein [Deltaproteobacteria bacterium]MBW2695031.1 isoprenylcysteine carboxylmethyltransferase family protein [Deltaproteobacteria bacterium]